MTPKEAYQIAQELDLSMETRRAITTLDYRWESSEHYDSRFARMSEAVYREQIHEAGLIRYIWRNERLMAQMAGEWGWYVVCSKSVGGQLAILRGAFQTQAEADAVLHETMNKAQELDLWAAFYLFSVVALPSRKNGILNPYFSQEV